MKKSSLWIIRIALTVQFVCVLAVPALVAAAESPRGIWLAEWVRPQSTERTIGLLRLRDGKLSFRQQVGEVGWELQLASLKRAVVSNGGRALTIESAAGERYVVAVMEPDLTIGSPKKVLTMIDRAMQASGAALTSR